MSKSPSPNYPLALALFIIRAQATDIRVCPLGWVQHANWARAAKDAGLADRGYVEVLDNRAGPFAVRPTKKLRKLRDRLAARNSLPAWGEWLEGRVAWGA